MAPAPPVNTGPPTISGTARDGETPTADPGTWSGTAPIDYAYEWRRCDAGGDDCADIAGATAPSLELTDTDVGATLRVRVTASNAAGQASAASGASGLVAAIAPANTGAPSVEGDATDGETLTADPGSWSGSEPIAFAYQWRRCDASGADCQDIDGATGQTHTARGRGRRRDDPGAVTASNAAGSATAGSDATHPVAGLVPVNTAVPTLAGTARHGQTLTAGPGTWSGTEPIEYAYQWQRCALGVCDDIVGATGQTYTLAAADIDPRSASRVSASNAPAGRAPTSGERPGYAGAAGQQRAPTTSGTARAGETLTADPGTWVGTEPIDLDYQWRRCGAGGDGCADIDGATAASSS